jgi:hypothetical protein
VERRHGGRGKRSPEGVNSQMGGRKTEKGTRMIPMLTFKRQTLL